MRLGKSLRTRARGIGHGAFSGCNKNDDDNALVGTKWQRVEPAENEGGVPITLTLTFTSGSGIKLEATGGTIGTIPGSCVYTDSEPERG